MAEPIPAADIPRLAVATDPVENCRLVQGRSHLPAASPSPRKRTDLEATSLTACSQSRRTLRRVSSMGQRSESASESRPVFEFKRNVGGAHARASLRGGGLLREHLSDASDLGTDSLEIFFDWFVAAIDVVDAVDDRLSIGHQCS